MFKKIYSSCSCINCFFAIWMLNSFKPPRKIDLIWATLTSHQYCKSLLKFILFQGGSYTHLTSCAGGKANFMGFLKNFPVSDICWNLEVFSYMSSTSSVFQLFSLLWYFFSCNLLCGTNLTTLSVGIRPAILSHDSSVYVTCFRVSFVPRMWESWRPHSGARAHGHRSRICRFCH